jgi:hypothetical protein
LLRNLDRKRKRHDSDSSPASHAPIIINNYILVYPGQALADGSKRSALDLTDSSSRLPCLTIPKLRDDVVEAHCKWHCSKVRRQDQRQQYELARDLTLERGLNLELIHEDNDAQLYIEAEVLEGVARQFAQDLKAFLDQYDAL